MVTAIRTDLEYQVLNSRADRNNPNNPQKKVYYETYIPTS